MDDKTKIKVMQDIMGDVNDTRLFSTQRVKDEPFILIINKANGNSTKVPLYAAKDVMAALEELL